LVVRAWHGDQNFAGDHLGGKALEMSSFWINPVAVQGIELPMMAAARQNRAVQIALDKGDSQVGATSLIGSQVTIELEEKDGSIAHVEALHLAFPNVFDVADFHEIQLLAVYLHSPSPSDVEPLQRLYGEILQAT
jgi:hypothetical protein